MPGSAARSGAALARPAERGLLQAPRRTGAAELVGHAGRRGHRRGTVCRGVRGLGALGWVGKVPEETGCPSFSCSSAGQLRWEG